MRSLQGRNSIASLPTGPSDFSGAHRMLPWQQALRSLRSSTCCCKPALRSFRARALHASTTAGPAVYAGTKIDCASANRSFGLFGHAHRMLPRHQALRCLRERNSFASLPTSHSVFSGTRIACFPNSRPCGVCGAANRLHPCKPALLSFRARASHASPTAGPAVFAGPQIDCVLANRPFGLFGHANRMLPRQQALRCLRGCNSLMRRKSIASLQTGP